MTFTIKALRTTATGAYSASLYEDGKRVAIVSDEGRGGAPRVEPVKAENWGKERTRLEGALSAWSHTLPWWYLTSFGTHPALDLGEGNYELSIGFLVECAEYNQLAKGKRLVRKAEGGLFRAPITVTVAAGSELLWNGENWVESI